jgi:hypothetical protein
MSVIETAGIGVAVTETAGIGVAGDCGISYMCV